MEGSTYRKLIAIEELRKETRKKENCFFYNRSVGHELVNVPAIERRLRKLTSLGADTREFQTFIRDLLLQQISQLRRMLSIERLNHKHSAIRGQIYKTRKYLWPAQNSMRMLG